MKKYALIFSLLSSCACASNADLMEILSDCAANARQNRGLQVGAPVGDLDSFASLADARGNFHEPEFYLAKLRENKMTKSFWLDVIAYLKEQENTEIKAQKPDKFLLALSYARESSRLGLEENK